MFNLWSSRQFSGAQVRAEIYISDDFPLEARIEWDWITANVLTLANDFLVTATKTLISAHPTAPFVKIRLTNSEMMHGLYTIQGEIVYITGHISVGILKKLLVILSEETSYKRVVVFHQNKGTYPSIVSIVDDLNIPSFEFLDEAIASLVPVESVEDTES